MRVPGPTPITADLSALLHVVKGHHVKRMRKVNRARQFCSFRIAMRLQSYHGPFDVGIVDLETTVRKPRDFIPGYIDPINLNKLVRGNKKVKHRRAAKILEQIRSGQNDPIEQEVNENDTEEVKKEREAETNYLEEHGLHLRNATLHFRTVLMAIYYPTSDLPKHTLKRYPRSSWLGRYVALE